MVLEDTTSTSPGASRETMDALANPRGRHVLRCLCDRRALTIEELATSIAEREPPSEPDADGRRRVLIDLYHCQLPRLADAGLVHYDHDGPVASITDRGERADAVARRVVGSRGRENGG